MKKKNVLARLILGCFLAAAIQSVMGCVPSGSSGTSASVEVPADTKQEKLSQIDQEIREVREEIEFTTDVINQEFNSWMTTTKQLKSGMHSYHDSRLNMSGGQSGLESNPEKLERHNKNLQAQNEHKDRLKEKLTDLERQRSKIMNQSSGCFPGRATVMMQDGSEKPFLEIRPGDMVMTYDIGYQKLVAKPVLEVFSFDANHLYRINKQVLTTGGERFLTKQGWKKTNRLQVGDFIHMDQEMIPVTSVEYLSENLKVYNMHVADTFNYYVGTHSAGNYLVHNSGGGGGGGGGGDGK